MTLDITGVFRQETAKQVEASYELTLLFSIEKQACTTRGTIVKLRLLSAAIVVLGTGSQEIYKSSLFHKTVKYCIEVLNRGHENACLGGGKIKAF
jgi:hypothetical protein